MHQILRFVGFCCFVCWVFFVVFFFFLTEQEYLPQLPSYLHLTRLKISNYSFYMYFLL